MIYFIVLYCAVLYNTVLFQVSWEVAVLQGMKDGPAPHRGGEIVRGLPCVKKLNQGGVNLPAA